MQTATEPHPPGTNGEATRPQRPALAGVVKSTRALPNRALIYAREGWGKTSFAAQAPGVVFLCTQGEDGLDKLIETGQVDETAHFGEQAKTWADVIARVDDLIVADHDYRVFCLDTINGAYTLLMNAVVAESFAGNAKEAGAFGGEQAGKLAAIKLRQLLARLDRLREAKRMSILLLSHTQIVKTPNPEGVDFDRYTPALEKKHVWPELARWCDLVLFGHIETFVRKENDRATKGKASGGTKRVLMTEGESWYDAKNRHGLTREIDCGDGAPEAWAAFAAAMKEGRGK